MNKFEKLVLAIAVVVIAVSGLMYGAVIFAVYLIIRTFW
jgi:hypothetical protein